MKRKKFAQFDQINLQKNTTKYTLKKVNHT